MNTKKITREKRRKRKKESLLSKRQFGSMGKIGKPKSQRQINNLAIFIDQLRTKTRINIYSQQGERKTETDRPHALRHPQRKPCKQLAKSKKKDHEGRTRT
jgi:hypothetical protein